MCTNLTEIIVSDLAKDKLLMEMGGQQQPGVNLWPGFTPFLAFCCDCPHKSLAPSHPKAGQLPLIWVTAKRADRPSPLHHSLDVIHADRAKPNARIPSYQSTAASSPYKAPIMCAAAHTPEMYEEKAACPFGRLKTRRAEGCPGKKA